MQVLDASDLPRPKPRPGEGLLMMALELTDTTSARTRLALKLTNRCRSNSLTNHAPRADRRHRNRGRPHVDAMRTIADLLYLYRGPPGERQIGQRRIDHPKVMDERRSESR